MQICVLPKLRRTDGRRTEGNMSKLLLAIICLWIGATLGMILTALIVAYGREEDREEWKDDRS